MNAKEFRAIVNQPLQLSRDQQLAIFHRVLGWLSADVSDNKGDARLRLMIATEIRRAPAMEGAV